MIREKSDTGTVQLYPHFVETPSYFVQQCFEVLYYHYVCPIWDVELRVKSWFRSNITKHCCALTYSFSKTLVTDSGRGLVVLCKTIDWKNVQNRGIFSNAGLNEYTTLRLSSHKVTHRIVFWLLGKDAVTRDNWPPCNTLLQQIP